jgi:hypothetical protein
VIAIAALLPKCRYGHGKAATLAATTDIYRGLAASLDAVHR